MALSEDPPDTKRYTQYRENPRGIIRTVDAYLTDLPNQPEDVVNIYVPGPEATGFIVLRPIDDNSETMTAELTYGHESYGNIESLGTMDDAPITTVLATMDEYLSQYWDQLNAFRIDISAMHITELRQPLQQEQRNPTLDS